MRPERDVCDKLVRHTLGATFAVLLLTPLAYAQTHPVSRELLDSLKRIGALPIALPEMTTSRVALDSNGFVRHLSAPASHVFQTDIDRDGDLEAAAYGFLMEHANVFGLTSEAVDLAITRRQVDPGCTYVRFQQTYEGVPIFGGQTIVQIHSCGGIESVFSDIMTDTTALDGNRVSSAPTLGSERAVEIVSDLAFSGIPDAAIDMTVPGLTFFVPSVLGAKGDPRLVWDVSVTSDTHPDLAERILVDAHNGEAVRRYPLAFDTLEREIHDADNTDADPGTLVRAEDEATSGIADADDAYDYLGDIYDFFDTHHGRDSVDDEGMLLDATVRYCRPGSDCPWSNASWRGSNERLYFGEGWVVDDIVGHEVTHGVTSYESDLIYENHSGAINESFSDVWGEFIDLENGAGSDSASVRWEIGEDLPDGAIRDMATPPRFEQPDRMGSSYFVDPAIFPGPGNDWGGVHTNSGVNNKLCYLLTDGATFNQWNVYGVGLDRVAGLYYEVNTRLLSSAADHTDLYYAMEQAAENLGWLPGDRVNLHKACAAVEIADTEGNVYVDGDHFGLEFGSDMFPFDTIAEAHNAIGSGNRMIIKSGTFNETLTLDKAIYVVARSGTVAIGR